MHKLFVATSSLLTVLAVAGHALAQPRPATPPLAQTPGPRAGGQPSATGPAMPAGPLTAPPKDIGVPNTGTYRTEVGGRKLEDWIKDIDSPDPSVREHAIRIVLEFGPAAPQ